MGVFRCLWGLGSGDRNILVYAYILIYCFKKLGFENEGFEVESFFRPPITKFEGPCLRLAGTGRQCKQAQDKFFVFSLTIETTLH